MTSVSVTYDLVWYILSVGLICYYQVRNTTVCFAAIIYSGKIYSPDFKQPDHPELQQLVLRLNLTIVITPVNEHHCYSNNHRIVLDHKI